jgi:hypothetical protein
MPGIMAPIGKDSHLFHSNAFDFITNSLLFNDNNLPSYWVAWDSNPELIG